MEDESNERIHTLPVVDFITPDEFNISKLEKANCKLVSPPRIFKSPASLECKLFKLVKLPGKNNTMIIGEVVGVHLSDKFIKEGIFDILAFNPVAQECEVTQV